MMKLNNKGYMLVEIIFAFVISFGILYFMMDLVIKLKNKNDDLLVETVVKTDSSIITNKLMEYAISDVEDNDSALTFCDNIVIEGQTIKYGDEVINVVDDTARIVSSGYSCNVDKEEGKVSVRIPVEVKQNKDGNFNIEMDYNYELGEFIIGSYCCLNHCPDRENWDLYYSGNCEVEGLNDINWKVKLLGSGERTFGEYTLKLKKNTQIDAFLVGGGGGGGGGRRSSQYGEQGAGGGGGGGGYTRTEKNISIVGGDEYIIKIGGGGSGGNANNHSTVAGGGGGKTSAFNFEVNGGSGGRDAGRDGRSPGGGGAGGNNGGSGSHLKRPGSNGGSYGGGATCEFGEGTSAGCTNGVDYAYSGGGGGAGGYNHSAGHGTCGLGGSGGGGGLTGGNGNYCNGGKANTGGGGGGGHDNNGGYSGGSGIVVIRNARKDMFSVTFDANGGTGVPESQTKVQDEDLVLSNTMPTKDGYTFLGWSPLKNDIIAVYQPGDIYSANEIITLYAVWVKDGIIPITSYSCANRSVGNNSYDLIYSGNCIVENEDGNWKVKFLTSGDLTLSKSYNIDVFLVGGGGSGGKGNWRNAEEVNKAAGGGGGGGGYTKTEKNITVNGTNTITIGEGGVYRNGGGTSSAFNLSAAGGNPGGNASNYHTPGTGGIGGNNGGNGSKSGRTGTSGGAYGGGATCEFGEGTSSGCIKGNSYAYSGGGGGGCRGKDYGLDRCNSGGIGGGGGSGSSGIANTGGGGGGGNWSNGGSSGGSGIVIIRNKR